MEEGSKAMDTMAALQLHSTVCKSKFLGYTNLLPYICKDLLYYISTYLLHNVVQVVQIVSSSGPVQR
jgi:hypothetical protein